MTRERVKTEFLEAMTYKETANLSEALAKLGEVREIGSSARFRAEDGSVRDDSYG